MARKYDSLNTKRLDNHSGLKISHDAGRTLPLEGGQAGPAPPGRSRRAAALIVGALVLAAAFVVVAPYLSSFLKQGYSVLSGSTVTGPGTQTSTTSPPEVTSLTNSTSTTDCSSVVSVQSLTAPDITNGSADISYPFDYCTLASYALGLINADRATNGTGPVVLDYNQAAQQHADSMLYYNYFSHFDTQGYAPYMRYSLLGGRGADFENVAFIYYSFPHFLSTGSVEGAIQSLEQSMVYNDSACCANGHRYNILSPLHNRVSIGVAYDSTHVYFDEEFENDYLNLNLTVTGANASNPYYVTLTGEPVQTVASPDALYVAYDSTPSPMSVEQLETGPHDYGPGTLIGGVLPRTGFFGDCGQFETGTTECADRWTFTPSTIDIAFSLGPFIQGKGTGVYTLYLVAGPSTDSSLTSISIFVT